MTFKRTSIALLASFLLSSTSNVSAKELSYRSINLVDNGFSTNTEFWNHVKESNIEAQEIIAECTSYIAVMNPVIQQGGGDLHEMNIELYMMLLNYTGSEESTNALVERKAKKYRQMLDNSYAQRDTAVIKKFGNAITICKDFHAFAKKSA